jgi:hypothetical protein
MYINADANNVMLQLYSWHDFYNIFLKSIHNLSQPLVPFPHRNEHTKESECATNWYTKLHYVLQKGVIAIYPRIFQMTIQRSNVSRNTIIYHLLSNLPCDMLCGHGIYRETVHANNALLRATIESVLKLLGHLCTCYFPYYILFRQVTFSRILKWHIIFNICTSP